MRTLCVCAVLFGVGSGLNGIASASVAPASPAPGSVVAASPAPGSAASAGSASGGVMSASPVLADPDNAFPDDLIAKVTRSVGFVRSAGVFGSGWIADHDTVITNLHVAKAGSGDIYVDFSDGQRIECYTAVADRDMDLAVLRCDTGSRHPIALDPRIPDAGTPVGVVGYPEGVGPTATTGQITGERIVARGIPTVRFTAAIASGSSGSPVFDSNGRVRAVATFSGGLGVPIEKLLPLLATAKRYPATKEAAEWRLRIRRSVMVGVSTLLIAWFFARRYGRNDPWKVALRWTIFMVILTLIFTQLLFAIHGPASFI